MARYAEERCNSLSSFVFTGPSGTDRTLRWSRLPAAPAVFVSVEDITKRGPDSQEQEIAARAAGATQTWTMSITLANPNDPTADPSMAWPDDRKTVEVGTWIMAAATMQAPDNGPLSSPSVFDAIDAMGYAGWLGCA